MERCGVYVCCLMSVYAQPTESCQFCRLSVELASSHQSCPAILAHLPPYPHSLQGWFPLYDTLKGARGELSLSVKLQFIGNENPFRDSSAGVRFFLGSTLNPEVHGRGIDCESRRTGELIVWMCPGLEGRGVW